MQKDISIIIVNYNVRHFLRRCIDSILNSKTSGLDMEIFVVDNASIDGSNAMIRKHFPDVILIANTDNVGFSVANNQAIREAKGKHILILNPDTVLQEDTLQTCYDHMEANDEIGAIGVKMIDGTGNFLPESKRALPTVWNSFSKLSGLAALFPKSRLFNQYALGYLDEDKNHVVDVLCGAFMYVRRTVIEEVGMFDERFFMYGEDIDWSRRIGEGGYDIHYLAGTAIIHYKGESTKKASLSYVKTFYHAMGLYVEKHYAGRRGRWFAQLLKLAISIRAAISGLRRLLTQLIWPLVDALLIGAGLKGFSYVWARYYFDTPNYYADSSLNWNVSLYACIWAFTLWFIGYYQKSSWKKRLLGISSGLVGILIFYALLPDDYRSSRLIILAGTFIAFIITSITALLFRRNRTAEKAKNILIVADLDVAQEIRNSLAKADVRSVVLGVVNPTVDTDKDLDYLNDLSQLGPLCKVLKADEIIFSTESMPMKEIMKQMMVLDTKLSFKIAGDDSLSIIGSSSKNTTGELYNVNIKYNLADGYSLHVKRVFDFTISILMILFAPILLFFNRFDVFGYFKNVIRTFLGLKSWIGYTGTLEDYQNLPELKPSVITLSLTEGEEAHLVNLYYARDYSVWTDLELLIKNLNKLT